MQLQSAERLRSFIGQGPEKKMSGRRLAAYVGCHPSFIDHLLSGRRRSCAPRRAEAIAEILGVPLEVLFVVERPSISRNTGKQGTAA